MLIASTEFFDQVEKKECDTCGSVILEMHDCYQNKCSDCRQEDI